MTAGVLQSQSADRLEILGICFFVSFSLLSGRLWILQGTRSVELQKEAEQICRTEEILPPKRGSIVDRNGAILVASQTVYSIYADKYHLRDYQYSVSGLAMRDGLRASEVRRKYSREDLLREYENYVVGVLAEGLKLDAAEVAAKLKGAVLGEVILARGLEGDTQRELSEVLAKQRVRGVYFRKETRRFYPDGRLLAHVLGYVDREGQGQEGLEKVLQAALSGVDGYRRTERDSRGQELAAFRRDEKQPLHGLRVRLTVDRGLQELLETSLDRAESTLHPEGLTVILMDPHDGQVLAMASRPAFDLESRRGSHRNLAVSLQYEPGSTFKLVTMAAAMDRGLLDLETKIPLAQGSRIGDEIKGEWLTPARVLAISSNEGIHTVARTVGAEGLYRTAVAFGFGAPTGIWLSGEESGRVRDPGEWSGTSLCEISMGYEVAVTPIQMVAALAAVANGGTLLQPRIVQALETAQGDVVYESKPRFMQRVMNTRSSAMLLKAMAEIASPGGTGEAARVPGFTVAGKTGTAWWFDPAAKKYQEGEVVASFVGAIPAEHPQLVGIVVVDRPQIPAERRAGGKTAAPLFSEIVRIAADYLDLIPSAELDPKERVL